MTSTFIATSVLALAALAGGSAFAAGTITGESGYTPVTNFTSSVDRTAVQADFATARKNGSLIVLGESGYRPVTSAQAVTPRSEVFAGLNQWVKSHPTDNMSN